ncbi:MAG: hypothetical protein WD770_01030 [Actinomycetota bacterium]
MPPTDPPPHELQTDEERPPTEPRISAEDLPEFLRDYRPVDRSA